MNTSLLYGMHDRQGHTIVPPGGWCLDTVSLSANEPPTDYAALRGDINWIVRLNWGYGSTGTIPLPADYDEFAARCANYATKSRGANLWIIGNEPNGEWERPDGVVITAADYARCFLFCAAAIKRAVPGAKTVHAAIAPYHANPTPWHLYLREVLRIIAPTGLCDALNFHAYARSMNPAELTSLATMDTPLQGKFHGFLTLLDAIDEVPREMLGLPAIITEFDVVTGWENRNTGIITAFYDWMHNWNRDSEGLPKFVGGVNFRWLGPPDVENVYDWEMRNKPQLLEDFKAAVGRGYQSPPVNGSNSVQEQNHLPFTPNQSPSVPVPTPDLPPRDVDSRAEARGTRIATPSVSPGEQFWRVKRLYTPNESESNRLGPNHHILANVLVDEQRQVGVPLLVTWGSGGAGERATIHTKKNDAFAFSADHPLSPGDFTLEVADGKPSEKVIGLKMGGFDAKGQWNPGAHESALVEYELVTMPATSAPSPTPHGNEVIAYVIAPNGANIRTAPDIETGVVLDAVPLGEQVFLSGHDQGADGKPWARVRYGTVMGWMRADMLGAEKPVTQPPLPVDPAPTQPTPEATQLIWPTTAPRTQRWGENPVFYQLKVGIPYHNGVDQGAAEGTEVRAMADGEVIFVSSDNGYGNYVRVYHAALGIHTFVAHLSRVLVVVGQMVKRGQVIAYSGSTGLTAGVINADGSADMSQPFPHTHTEIRLGERDAYAEGTFGHSNGRVDPETVMYLVNRIAGWKQGGTDVTYDDSGGKLNFPVPSETIDPLLAEAVLNVESNGSGFEGGRLRIRFEAHIFDRYLANQDVFDRHFRYNAANGLEAWGRPHDKAAWIPYHEGGQAGEWAAFELASGINRTAALLSTSIGAPQIMGFHHADIGYNTPQAMFAAFGRSVEVQIIGFFNFCIYKRLVEPMRRKDLAEIIRLYNGVGNEAIYLPRLVEAYRKVGGA